MKQEGKSSTHIFDYQSRAITLSSTVEILSRALDNVWRGRVKVENLKTYSANFPFSLFLSTLIDPGKRAEYL